ncbi:MAG: glycoside hydrolase family 30 protein, partial [Acholeplasmataceae bacterium]
MKVIRTSLTHNERLKEVEIEHQKKASLKEIVIDKNKEAQTMIGFGGAFTESSAYNLGRINKTLRDQAIKAYFDPVDGLGYTMGRVSIHGCDFSLGSYLYIDDFDDSLSSFKIDRDKPVLDLIQDAQKFAKQPIKLIASPWTPPFWMKDNQSPIFGGKLLPKYDQIWANYFVKFIEAYEKAGAHIFAVTIQNEPMAKQRWDSCIFENEDECRFLKVLGPTLKDANYQDKHILIWDHNRDVMVERASHIYADQEASQYAWGTAFHWYDQEQFQEVAKHKALFPEKHLIFTEGCQENGPHFDDYAVGERYGRNMIHDLKNGTEAYVDWNL